MWDEDFSVASTSHLASTKAKINQVISDLFSNSEWRYADEFCCAKDTNDERDFDENTVDAETLSSSRSDFYFDNNWDVLAIEEDLHLRQESAKLALAHAIQKNGKMRKLLGLEQRSGDVESSSDDVNESSVACSSSDGDRHLSGRPSQLKEGEVSYAVGRRTWARKRRPAQKQTGVGRTNKKQRTNSAKQQKQRS